ncbi:MAG TPA: AbrB/MazE/SpoVT family DNA-binding domain-containing protein [Candidatus Nitrosotalea sp.]|jgi:AbrB family looped-hinge helix DNA binding protein|nr:AbrB/MazE/SpoVT family DNA-binding domain-containing protein [Candidatus Nitrosotalea sp.]
MTGSYDQPDPTIMFREWIQRSGKAQMDFMKTFGDMMNRSNQSNPLDTLKEMADKTTRAQSDMVQNFADTGSKAMYNWFNLAQNLPQFSSWGAFKTSVGSNGRISIPEAEREAIGIRENDLVQVIVVPIHKSKSHPEVKK